MRNHFKKIIAVSALVVMGVFAAPMAANAATPGYAPTGSVIVTGTVTASGTVTVTFTDGTFIGGETVSFSVTGSTSVTLSAASVTTTGTKVANADGSVVEKVTLPTNASGTYNLTATGNTSGTVATAALTVVPADSGAAGGSGTSDPGAGSLAFTGSNVSMLVLWTAGGAIVLGIGLMVVFTIVRRQRSNQA